MQTGHHRSLGLPVLLGGLRLPVRLDTPALHKVSNILYIVVPISILRKQFEGEVQVLRLKFFGLNNVSYGNEPAFTSFLCYSGLENC